MKILVQQYSTFGAFFEFGIKFSSLAVTLDYGINLALGARIGQTCDIAPIRTAG